MRIDRELSRLMSTIVKRSMRLLRTAIRPNYQCWRRDGTPGWLVANVRLLGSLRDGQAQSGGRRGMGRASG